MGLDIATLAARTNLDPKVVAEIEAGTRVWTVDELSALFKSDEYGRSVFKREMDQLMAAGYQQLGKLGDPNDPLRMEPPCK